MGTNYEYVNAIKSDLIHLGHEIENKEDVHLLLSTYLLIEQLVNDVDELLDKIAASTIKRQK